MWLLSINDTSFQVVSSVKWLEDEMELNALHSPGSHRGSGNEKAATTQRAALAAALGGQVDIASMSTISGDKFVSLCWFSVWIMFISLIRCSLFCLV